MLISLRDVPRDERHLLFCSRLLPRQRRRRHPRRNAQPPTKDQAPATVCIPLAAGLDAAGTDLDAA